MKKLLKKVGQFLIGFFGNLWSNVSFDEIREKTIQVTSVFEVVKAITDEVEVEEKVRQTASDIDDKVYQGFIYSLGALGLVNTKMQEAENKAEFIRLLAEEMTKKYTRKTERFAMFHMVSVRVLERVFPKVPSFLLSLAVSFVYAQFKQEKLEGIYA